MCVTVFGINSNLYRKMKFHEFKVLTKMERSPTSSVIKKLFSDAASINKEVGDIPQPRFEMLKLFFVLKLKSIKIPHLTSR